MNAITVTPMLPLLPDYLWLSSPHMSSATHQDNGLDVVTSPLSVPRNNEVEGIATESEYTNLQLK